MIAFDICARSIFYLLCLISEFSSIIKIKTLLALPSMCHITSIFSKNHVQFLGTSAPWISLKFQLLLPCCMNWSCALWDDTWPVEIHYFFIPFPNLTSWNDYFTSLMVLLVQFLSHPTTTILPLGEDWSFGLFARDNFSISACCHRQSGSGHAGCAHISVSFSILCCLLNFSFKHKLSVLTQSFITEWLNY